MFPKMKLILALLLYLVHNVSSVFFSDNLSITCQGNQVKFSSLEGLFLKEERTWFSLDSLTVLAFEKFNIESSQGSYKVSTSKKPSFETKRMDVIHCSVVDDVAIVSGVLSGAIVSTQNKNEIENISLSFDYNMTFKMSDVSTSDVVDAIDFSLDIVPSDSISRSYSFQQSAVYAHLEWISTATQDYFGFGEQYSHVNMKGKKVPILVQEQGVGRGLEPISFVLGIQAGNEFTTYAPFPMYLATDSKTPSSDTAAHAFMIHNSEYSVFDMTQDNITSVELLRPNFGLSDEPILGTLFRSTSRTQSPLDLIRGITAYTGRMRSLPSWILRGAVIGLEGGTDQVTEILKTLRDHDVDVSALWLQDWSGVNVDTFGERVEWNW
jgi:hypothetical protein